jgi:GNAT superfamily N-acetyltransferase
VAASVYSARPVGFDFHHVTLSFDLTADPAPHDLAVIGESLGAFNDADVGPAGRQPLVIFVRDEDGEIAGGLSGHTAWGWLYVQWLWLAEALRGQGLAARLLAMAEAEALRRGCHGAWIDTFNPVALKTYQRAGYLQFGALEDFPKGRTRTFLQKRLQP